MNTSRVEQMLREDAARVRAATEEGVDDFTVRVYRRLGFSEEVIAEARQQLATRE